MLLFGKAEDNAEGYILLIRCYSRNNDLNYLESTAIKAVSKFESDSKLWSCIGDEWKRNKEYKKAVVSYKKASALNSKSAWYWRQLGESYFHLQDFKNAIDAFNHSIEADPDNELYCYWLSKVYLADNQLGLAYSEINKAIASYSGVKDYFIQCCAYAVAHHELYGTGIRNIAVLVTVANGEPQIFEKDAVPYIPFLKNRRIEFDRLG